MILLVIPVYLLTLEIYGPATAWLGCLLVIATLLTPLDFLVVAGLSRGQDIGWPGVALEIALSRIEHGMATPV